MDDDDDDDVRWRGRLSFLLSLPCFIIVICDLCNVLIQPSIELCKEH